MQKGTQSPDFEEFVCKFELLEEKVPVTAKGERVLRTEGAGVQRNTLILHEAEPDLYFTHTT